VAVGSWTVTSTSATAISHVLFMLQENHSFDKECRSLPV
jgi:phospholipase C